MAINLDSEICEKLGAIVGADNVVAQASQLEYLSRTAIVTRHIPKFIVYAQDTAQVQQIVALANQVRLPLWYISKGCNWGYGATSAAYQGGITLVLEKMNRILSVNEDLGYAVLEPGVTFEQLNQHLKDTGSRLWADCPGSTVNASVLGNALDRGRGLTPYADHFGALCGLEVVLPSGEVLLTGGGPDQADQFPTWNVYKWGVGPYLDGLFSQSSFGIVTKAGVWLMPAPAHFNFFIFEYNQTEDKFADFLVDLRELLFRKVITCAPHIANSFAMLCIVSQYPHASLGPGQTCLSEQALQQWEQQHGVQAWTFACALYGSRAEVKLKRREATKVLKKYGSLTFAHGLENDNWLTAMVKPLVHGVLKLKGKSLASVEGLPDAIKLFKGIPSDYFVKQVYAKSHPEKPKGKFNPARDGCGFIWIGPSIPFEPVSLQKLMQPVKQEFRDHGFDFFVEIIIESPRCLFVLFGIFYDKTSNAETDRAQRLYRKIHAIADQLGFPPYRETIGSMQDMFGRNPVLSNLLFKIKSALDPNSILAPGRYGCGRPVSHDD